MNTAMPSVETTKKFILIKIPRALLLGEVSHKKISVLERGLRESIAEAQSGKLVGPFRSSSALLHALKKQV